jgi:ribosomal protein S18 acetylase RimI-like enzyme
MFTSSTTQYQLRPLTPTDLPFLLALYTSTRATELSMLDWPDEQKKFFIHSQFQHQQHYYQQVPAAQLQIITVNGQAVGRLYYGWEENALRLMDIALLPEYQHQKIGSAIMHELKAQAVARKKSILLHVELNNSAQAWYLKIGFVAKSDDGVYQKMQWDSE